MANREDTDIFVETREPVEFMFCIIIAAAYIGLAKFWWEHPDKCKNWMFFLNLEGLLITITLLTLLLGLRPYLSPSYLKISKSGIKYRGPYWPVPRTLLWSQVFRLYVSPELILILYRKANKPKSIRPLLIFSVHLAAQEEIVNSILKYGCTKPVLLGSPSWFTRTIQYTVFALILFWIANLLLSQL